MQLILTHEHTDFDALASLLGAALLYPEATAVLPRRMNRNVSEFVTLYRSWLPFVRPAELPKGRIDKVILVDTRALNAPRALVPNCEVIVIDHHTDPEESDDRKPPERPRSQRTTPKTWTIHAEPVGANATLLVERIVKARVRLTSLHATLLALGIHEDTNSLTYGGTTARDAAALAWLLEPAQGINIDLLSRFLNHPLSDEQRELLRTLIQASEFVDVGGLNVVIAVAQVATKSEEISTIAARLRDYHEPDALFVLVAMEGMVQVVARSTTDEVDVGAIMRTLGGGGHVRAAAAPVHSVTIDEIKQRIRDGLALQARRAVTVRAIMSQGKPQTLDPEMRIADAARLMRRYGYEGFPVVADEILGVLTRREADRAMDHGLGNEKVKRFMRAGAVSVKPDDSLAQLRRSMSESGWGQIPVVDEGGALIGIVTRTDLIRTWENESVAPASAGDVAERLVSSLSPVQLGLLRLAGARADALGFTPYVVGGFVRDLFVAQAAQEGAYAKSLGEFDIDIVVEGDAIALANAMVTEFGGRVVLHRQFGTAKWLIADEENPIKVDALKRALESGEEDIALPPHLDFISARTEFYTEPAALPTVESGSIRLDLLRRDFTINTLALSLAPNRWAELTDDFGGMSDLQQGVVRVLHSLSFVDDATRILRAVRYEQRFGFQIEARTLELISDALPLLDRVSPARVRHEIERILQESVPERILQRLDALGILTAIHPALRAGEWVANLYPRVRMAWHSPATDAITLALRVEPLERLYWAALVYPLPADADETLTERLKLRRETQRLVRSLHRVRAKVDLLANPNLDPSEVVAALESHEEAEIALAALLTDNESVQRHVRAYLENWRHVHPQLDGNDLQRLGVARGPQIRAILWALRAARLNGGATSLEQEEAIVLSFV